MPEKIGTDNKSSPNRFNPCLKICTTLILLFGLKLVIPSMNASPLLVEILDWMILAGCLLYFILKIRTFLTKEAVAGKS